MAPLAVVVLHLLLDDGLELVQGPGVGKQGPILVLEPSPEGLDPGVALGAVLGVRDPRAGIEQQRLEPGVAGEDGILVLMDDGPGYILAQLAESRSGALSGFEGQRPVRRRADGPAGHPRALQVEEADEPRLAVAAVVAEFREVRGERL